MSILSNFFYYLFLFLPYFTPFVTTSHAPLY